MSVSNKLFKGAVWNAASQFGSQGLNFVILVILARLLAPEDFGLYGMANIFIALLGYFAEVGLITALIQAEKIDDEDCQTVFWSISIFSSVIYAVMYFSAPLIAFFYKAPEMTHIVRILFLNIFFTPLVHLPAVAEIRRLHYDKIAKAELIAVVVSGAVSIALAMLKFGVWSLIIQHISLDFSRGMILSISTGWRPKVYFSFTRLKRLIKAGCDFAFNGLILYCSRNIDSLLVGKLLGPAALGIYNLALRLISFANTKLWLIFGEMFLPAFASFRNEIDRLKKNFLKVSIGGGLLLIPFLLCLFFGAQSFVALTYGEKWASTVPIIRILIIYVMFDSLFLSDEAILIVMDKVRSVNMQRTFAFIMLSMIGYILINKFGLIGMAVALTLISIITIIAIKAILLKLLNIRPYEYLKSLAMVFKSALVLFALLYVYSFFIDGLHSPLIFITGEALIFTGFVAFVMFKYGLIDLSGKKIELNRLLQNNI